MIARRERRACSQPTNSKEVQGCRDTSLHGKIRILLSSRKFKQCKALGNLKVENLRWIHPFPEENLWQWALSLRFILHCSEENAAYSFIYCSYSESGWSPQSYARVQACVSGWLEGAQCPPTTPQTTQGLTRHCQECSYSHLFYEFQCWLCLWPRSQVPCVTCNPLAG